MAVEHDTVANVHLKAVEHDRGIVFLYEVSPGPASRSYGIQVAELAGVPREVVRQARRQLERLEAEDRGGRGRAQLDLFAGEAPEPGAESARNRPGDSAASAAPDPEAERRRERADALRDALEAIDPDGLSPREALELLFRFKEMTGPGALMESGVRVSLWFRRLTPAPIFRKPALPGGRRCGSVRGPNPRLGRNQVE